MAPGNISELVMGFLSGLSGILGGGSQSSDSVQSGFSLLSPQIQGAYNGFATNLTNQLPNLTQAYTPLAQTAGETQAYNAIDQGFTPNQQTLNSDINMQMNPYDSSVIDTINRQSGGDYSILKQNASQAGQFGSNRQNLGANDIDLSRLQQIGDFKQGEYNTALQNALTTLPQERMQDAAAQLGAGNSQRQLALQTSSAPITALQQYAQALQALPSSGGSTQTSTTSGSQTGTGTNLLSAGGGIFDAVSTLLASDINLKENIESVGEENGHALYEFNYKGDPKRWVGVMAQDVQKTHPQAVEMVDGYLAVDYDKIGVEFREVAHASF